MNKPVVEVREDIVTRDRIAIIWQMTGSFHPPSSPNLFNENVEQGPAAREAVYAAKLACETRTGSVVVMTCALRGINA